MANDPEFCKAQNGRNIWLCYFLPITNCSVPLKGVKEARDTQVNFLIQAQDALEFTDMGNTVSPRAEVHPKSIGFEEARALMSGDSACPRGLNAQPSPGGCTLQNSNASCCREWGEVHNGFLLHQVMYRLNYRSRAAVAKIKHEFMQNKKWEPRNCTTLHIRRTDKISGKCLKDPHNPAFRQLPGFNRSFENYMSEAKMMMGKIGSSRLFIMSDDGLFVNEHLNSYPHDGNFVTMSGHGLMTAQDEHSFADTYSGTKQSHSDETHLFFASLFVGGECRSQIVNSASGIAGTLRRTACAMQWQCVSTGATRDLKKFRSNNEMKEALDDWNTNKRTCR
jgi:hypothetical protein